MAVQDLLNCHGRTDGLVCSPFLSREGGGGLGNRPPTPQIRRDKPLRSRSLNGRRLVAPALLLAALAALLPAAASAAGSTTASANVPWYLSRATGFVAYLLLFLTVSLGLAIRTKALDRLVARWRVTDIHTFLSVLVALFVVVHVVALLGDRFIGFSVVQLLVPFASSFQPVWTGVGIITAYLLLLVLFSFPARRFIGYRAWRSLHYLTFLVYVGALVHGLFAGSDSSTIWAKIIYLGTVAVVLAFTLSRVEGWRRYAAANLLPRTRPQPREARSGFQAAASNRLGSTSIVDTPAPEVLAERRAEINFRAAGLSLVAVGLPLALFMAAAIGPFRWWGGNSDAGSVDQVSASASGPASGSSARSLVSAGFSDTFTGTVTQGGRGRRNSMTLHLDAGGQQTVSLDMQLRLAQDSSGQTQVTGGNAILTG
ncbi:MAG: ferric reductase-like transmembrane domain-containing protein, partial [Dehalococcoidia bacterium]